MQDRKGLELLELSHINGDRQRSFLPSFTQQIYIECLKCFTHQAEAGDSITAKSDIISVLKEFMDS